MKVWIDILTPKQALFFMNLCLKLEERGYQVIKTTRRYREVTQLLKIKGLKAKVVGEHGGENLYEKLKKSAERIIKLASLIKESSPDLAISFSSVEASRVAFGLKIPHYCISDSPHAEAASKLTIPLSKKLFTPFVIPEKAWIKYGISESDIIFYKALDPITWLKKFKINKNVLSKLNLKENKPLITIRVEETFAAYLLDKSLKESIAIKAAHLLSNKTDAQIVILPRYKEQINFLKKEFKKENVKIACKVIDGASLLALSSVFIGAGGTMTAEAALLGVPTISCYPSKPTYIEKFLIKQDLIKRSLNPKNICKLTLSYINNEEVKKESLEKAKKITSIMEDPTEIILNKILELES
jgi:predicted glycosyltransferase